MRIMGSISLKTKDNHSDSAIRNIGQELPVPAQENDIHVQRQVEVRALISLADRIESGAKDVSFEDALRSNSRLWGLFYDKAMTDRSTSKSMEFQEYKLNENIIKLANFVFKKTAVILDGKDYNQAPILARLNREIAEGMKN